MQQIMPAKFLKSRDIAEIPRSEYIETPSETHLLDTDKRKSFISMLRLASSKPTTTKLPELPTEYSFNVAVWLRASKAQNHPISLLLKFEDEAGVFVVMVEETRIDSARPVMFSGLVNFTAKGVIKSLQVTVSGLPTDETIIVDELFIQRNIEQSDISIEQKKRA
jgi:hypothetical protein